MIERFEFCTSIFFSFFSKWSVKKDIKGDNFAKLSKVIEKRDDQNALQMTEV